MLISAFVLMSLPVGWATLWVTSLVYANAQLNERNELLTETANEVLLELDSLDEEVQDLQERAGLPDRTLTTPKPQDSQGGVPQPVEAESLFERAKDRLPRLSFLVDGEVRPALEETLAEEATREAAFPNAVPLRGKVDVSSEFGLRPNPFGGRGYEHHNGIDFRGKVGTPIYATANGVVTKAQHSGGYGKHVVIDHGYGYETIYAHLSTIDVEVGTRVTRGRKVGELGNTGRSTGPHLHYSIYRQGKAVNPRYYLQLDSDS